MEDSLKNFIDKNREAFDSREPSEKIWKGVESSLPGMQQRSLWNSVAVWRAAAVLFLGLSVYFFISRPTLRTQPKEMAQAQIEFTDLETFYSRQIAEKVAMINDLETAEGSDQFTQDFQKLDAMYQVLLEEMKSHPGEKVKNALVLNLLVRIDLLNQQIKKLEDLKKPEKKNSSAIV